MDFKKLLDKLQDKVQSPSSIKPSPVVRQPQQRSFEEKKFTALSKWRGKWGNVSKPRLFSNTKKDHHKTTDTSCPSSIHEPTIPLSSPAILQRPHSLIGHVSNLDCSQHQQSTPPTSYTPSPRRRQSRLSVPYVVNHLRSTTHGTPYTSLDVYSDDDTGSFYNALPPQRSTWCHLSSHRHNDDDERLDDTAINSASSFFTGLVSKDDYDRISNGRHSLVFVENQATPSLNETSQQHKGVLTSYGGDHPPAAISCQEEQPHYQLATLNVANTMMAMREQQLELQMEKLRMKNQQLEQQMEDVVSGTWTSTTQLIEENDRLESQIRQLQRQLQRRMKQPPPINGSGESYLQDEQEALRHTRAQLGLVEYLEGEPDVMAALNRFKTLLTSSC